MPGLNTSDRSNRQIFLRPAGNPRFGRATSQPPRPSGTSILKGFACSCCPWLIATLIDESVGCIQPWAISHSGPRAIQATGDQRINSFGIGGEMEIRSGLLVQKQPIAGPVLHFGLGEETAADVVRVVWPNGSVRADFEIKTDQTVVIEQRLKGSCPFLFAYNVKEIAFVKDTVPWAISHSGPLCGAPAPRSIST